MAIGGGQPPQLMCQLRSQTVIFTVTRRKFINYIHCLRMPRIFVNIKIIHLVGNIKFQIARAKFKAATAYFKYFIYIENPSKIHFPIRCASKWIQQKNSPFTTAAQDLVRTGSSVCKLLSAGIFYIQIILTFIINIRLFPAVAQQTT